MAVFDKTEPLYDSTSPYRHPSPLLVHSSVSRDTSKTTQESPVTPRHRKVSRDVSSKGCRMTPPPVSSLRNMWHVNEWGDTRIRHVAYMSESCGHIWVSHLTHLNELHDTYACHVTHVTHMSGLCESYEWVTSLILSLIMTVSCDEVACVQVSRDVSSKGCFMTPLPGGVSRDVSYIHIYTYTHIHIYTYTHT